MSIKRYFLAGIFPFCFSCLLWAALWFGTGEPTRKNVPNETRYKFDSFLFSGRDILPPFFSVHSTSNTFLYDVNSLVSNPTAAIHTYGFQEASDVKQLQIGHILTRKESLNNR